MIKQNNNINLAGKSILLIALSDYSIGIVSKMKELGMVVDYLNDKPNDGVICKSFGRLHIKSYENRIHKYYQRRLITTNYNKKYDFILVIRGEYTPIKTLAFLRKKYEKSKMILYMWDSVKNSKGIEKKYQFFDKVFTFDRIDYLNDKRLHFLPLFYYDNYLPSNLNSGEFDYDLCFVGTAHQDRIKIVELIKKQFANNGLSSFSYYYLPQRLIYLLNKIINKNYKRVEQGQINFKKIPLKDLYAIYSKSKCILDIESSNQHGLTMRTIEMIGLHKKLITTNKDIVNYDFYNTNNILVINRDNPVIDVDFLHKEYEELSPEIYFKYSLTGWILNILR